MDILAPAAPTVADEEITLGYARWPEKGEVVEGRRITLLTARTQVAPGEEVRVLHVAEATGGGARVYTMGPKRVFGEEVDGTPTAPAAPAGDDPLLPPGLYDGPAVPGPAVDAGWEVTRYRFEDPGPHDIVWHLGPLVSNTLRIIVARPPDAR